MRVRVVLRDVDGGRTELDMEQGVWGSLFGTADLVTGEGMWALPGLVDGHAHFSWETLDEGPPGDPVGAEVRAEAAVRAGVMLAFDKGGSDLTGVELLERVSPDRRPDIEVAGVLHAVAGGYFPHFTRELDPEHFEGAMELASLEAPWIKLIGDWPRTGVGPLPNFTEDQLRRAVEIAGAAGGKVAVHTMARDVPSMAVRAGVQSIEHGIFLVEDDLEALGARGGYWVPTILRLEAVIAQLGESSSGGRLLTEGLRNVERMLPLAVEAGVRVLAGSDLAVGTHQVALEAMRMREAGLSNRQALAAATSVGLDATDRGGFRIGRPANAVLFEVNPLDDLRALMSPAVVMRRGVIL